MKTVSLHAGVRNPYGKRTGLFHLLRTAQGLLYRKGEETQARTCWCHRRVLTKWGDIYIYRKKDASGARFSGVSKCGMVWTCPVCAAAICEARREELSFAMVKALEKSLHAYLLTLTFPHTDQDELGVLLEKQAKALQSFKNSRTYKRFMLAHRRAGSVRSLEVTWGTNGWHPHTHDLVFAAPGMLEDRAGIRALKLACVRALVKAGLYSNPEGSRDKFMNLWKHCLDIRGGAGAAEYVAKFGRDERYGLSSEITKPHAKIGIRKVAWSEDLHFTPFQLLQWAANGDRSAAYHFCEYAREFEGKRMLSWSPGLKADLGLLDREDEELADRDREKDEECAGVINAEKFSVIVSRNRWGEFLEFVSMHCHDPGTSQGFIDEFIEAMRSDHPATFSNVLRRRDPMAVKGWSDQAGGGWA